MKKKLEKLEIPFTEAFMARSFSRVSLSSSLRKTVLLYGEKTFIFHHFSSFKGGMVMHTVIRSFLRRFSDWIMQSICSTVACRSTTTIGVPWPSPTNSVTAVR